MPNNNDKNVTKRDLWRVLLRYMFTFQWSWNYERMQALGFAWSIMPILEKVNETKEDLKLSLQRHLNFFNTHPPMGAGIIGAAAALEEQGAEGEAVDSLKVGLMGPLAGIGDTLFAILTRPIIGVFAASMALGGSMGGFWLMILFGLFWGIGVKIYLFWQGYQRGADIVQDTAAGGTMDKLTTSATILGLTVIGGFVPSILSGVTTPLEYTETVEVEGELTEQVVAVQDVLDQLLPYLIPVLFVALAYWMLRGPLKWSPIKVLLALVVIAFGGSLIGIL